MHITHPLPPLSQLSTFAQSGLSHMYTHTGAEPIYRIHVFFCTHNRKIPNINFTTALLCAVFLTIADAAACCCFAVVLLHPICATPSNRTKKSFVCGWLARRTMHDGLHQISMVKSRYLSHPFVYYSEA